MFSTDLYQFDLPEELIAKHPVEPRDASRLLVIHRKEGRWEHRRFLDLPDYLGPQDVLVANNTRVMASRLLGRRILNPVAEQANAAETYGGQIEFLLLEEVEPLVWEGLFKSSATTRPGVRFWIPTPDGKGLRGEILRGSSESETGTIRARLDRDPLAAQAGILPLPPYLERAPESSDQERYQTVYGKSEGSAAAPTAGLHFTPRVLEKIAAQGASWLELTLHVGLGTFRPVKASDLREHRMHEERYELTQEVAQALTQSRQNGKKITAVGTTAVRTLESAWQGDRWVAGQGRTSVFFYPQGPHSIQTVDHLLTNFHLPQSTLLMLVSAFAGRELVLNAYQDAIREKYRFFSYGDAMLIL